MCLKWIVCVAVCCNMWCGAVRLRYSDLKLSLTFRNTQHTRSGLNKTKKYYALQRTLTLSNPTKKYYILQHTQPTRLTRAQMLSFSARRRISLLVRECSTLQQTVPHCNTLQHTASSARGRISLLVRECNTLQQTEPHCTALQHTAARGSDLIASERVQHTAPHSSTLQHTASSTRRRISLLVRECSTLEQTVPHCNTLQHTATRLLREEGLVTGDKLQHTVTSCSTLQHAATHCNILQHAATRCNTLHLLRKEGSSCARRRIFLLSSESVRTCMYMCKCQCNCMCMCTWMCICTLHVRESACVYVYV